VLARSPRTLALWLAAAVVAVATAVIVASDLAALHRHAGALGEERDAIVATGELTLGTIVSRDDVRSRRIHRSQLPPDVLPSVAEAVGRVVTVPVVRGGFLSGRNLAPRHRNGLDGALPTGTRAMRVVVTDTLRPRVGAAVDVYVSLEQSVGDTSADQTEPALVVAAAVSVLDTDAAAGTDGGDAFGVTLLVSPRQARALAFAATHGVITLALVPPEEARAP
jgi:Flp pilus assembly protein CpaB